MVEHAVGRVNSLLLETPQGAFQNWPFIERAGRVNARGSENRTPRLALTQVTWA